MHKYFQVCYEGEGNGGATPTPEPAKTPDPTPTPEPVPAPAVAPGTEPAKEPAPAAEPPKKKEWYYERIDELTADKYRSGATIQQLQTQLAQIQAQLAPQPQPGQQVPPVSQADLERLIDAEASRRASVGAFNKECDSIFDQGAAVHGEDKMEEAMASLRRMAGGAMPIALVEAAMETDNPAEVLFVLGNDSEKALDVLKLSPLKMAARVSRMAAAMTPAPRIQKSNAPEPIRPQVGKSVQTGGIDEPGLSTEEWMRRRNAEIAQKQPARR